MGLEFASWNGLSQCFVKCFVLIDAALKFLPKLSDFLKVASEVFVVLAS